MLWTKLIPATGILYLTRFRRIARLRVSPGEHDVKIVGLTGAGATLGGGDSFQSECCRWSHNFLELEIAQVRLGTKKRALLGSPLLTWGSLP